MSTNLVDSKQSLLSPRESTTGDDRTLGNGPLTVIKPRFSQHTDVLTLNVKPRYMSLTCLDMKVTDEKTGEEVFEVYGKLAGAMSREVHIRECVPSSPSGTPSSSASRAREEEMKKKTLYIMKQKKCAMRYAFKAKDQELEEQSGGGTDANDTTVFTSVGKGGFGNDTFDLDVSFRASGSDVSTDGGKVPKLRAWESGSSTDEGEMQKLSVKTGIMKDVSEILTSDGNIVARIVRRNGGLRKSCPCERYRLEIMPRVDSSLILLALLSVHVQFVDWKVVGGTVFLAAAGLIGK